LVEEESDQQRQVSGARIIFNQCIVLANSDGEIFVNLF